MKKELIGHVAVDSGQLLLCDPCYIDSQWKDEEFADIRIYKHVKTGKTLQYKVDFPNYATLIEEYGKDMNELIATGEWEQQIPTSAHGFSYNACCNASLSENGHGQLRFELGHVGAGIAFSTAFGDGFYPVYAKYDNKGVIKSVTIELQ